ncbi:variable large family protein [Borreliella bavariensis]|uniref:variable large family protein n=1 Tax=Borreliella bavariensis TaxID=664662 RepID=UPI00165D762C|nr:variable large family protein [Borreliella bavariensis]
MKKISSAIFIVAFLALIGCKNNVGGDDKKDTAASIFYQSIINLGNGFIEVFNAFSGLVADAFSKADPKKSDVKTYFDSITKTLKDTKTKLEDISKEKTGGEKTPAVEGIAEVVKTVGEWLDGLIKAAEGGGKAADGGGSDKIGNVAAAGGAGADKESVLLLLF